LGQLLLYGDSVRNANLYYRTGFVIADPILYFEADGRETLVVSGFEKSRAQKESRIDDVRSSDELGYTEAFRETGDPTLADVAVIRNLAGQSDDAIQVEATFPILLADRLRDAGIRLVPNRDLIRRERRTKDEREIKAIARAQARSEQAIAHATEILREAIVLEDSVIYRGVPLSSERLKGELEAALVKDGFLSESTIVAPGPGSSDPHWTGSGPIRPGQPLILDIFPQDRSTRYFGDVTRTFVKGEASPELLLMHDTVKVAQQRALDMIRPGVNGRDVFETVMTTFADAGFGDGGSHNARCLHGTGHGVGLEVHELPRIGRVDEELLVGDVVSVEPGLYDPEIGGVRIEDLVVLTEGGHRNLNQLPKELVIP